VLHSAFQSTVLLIYTVLYDTMYFSTFTFCVTFLYPAFSNVSKKVFCKSVVLFPPFDQPDAHFHIAMVAVTMSCWCYLWTVNL